MRRRVWERWQRAAGPWKGWSQCPSLLAPEGDDVLPRPEPRPAAGRIATALQTTLSPGGVLLILDLDPIVGVEVAARLSEAQQANAVVVVPRWPYTRAVLPVDGLLYALQAHAQRLHQTDERLPNVAFVLDADRAMPIRNRSPRDQRADNRYRLLVSDLPDLASLRARGVRQLVRLSGL